MNKNILIVMSGGVLVAVLVAMLVQFGLSGSKKVEVVEEGKVSILVASKDLRIGHELADGDLKWQSWPESSVFSGAIRREDDQETLDALNGRLARNVAEGEPVLKSATVSENADNFVAASLRPGYRAIALEVKAQSMAGGFITPGDYVDVLLTYRIDIDPGENDYAEQVISRNIYRHATETILENVKVLATDQKAERDDEDDIKVAKTVTLEVDVEGAEKMALAAEMGDMTLALRGIGDDAVTAKDQKRPVVTDVRMTDIVREVTEEYEGSTGGPRNQVRIYNGPMVQSSQTR